MDSDNVQVTLQKVYAFLAAHPPIQSVTPASPEYAAIRAAFALLPDLNPCIIVRPPTIPDAVALVAFLIASDIPFAVRAGGHDNFGRSFQDQVVALDLRLINHVEVDPSGETARIGGGALLGDVIPKLHGHGLVAATGTISVVGYVGWALYGGYGPYSSQFGLGVDQIRAAKVINAQGELMEADADLLRAIRGAGGAFGVVTEITVPVHRLDKVLAGIFFFDSSDLPAVIRQYNHGYQVLSAEGIPSALNLQQAVINTPTGKAFIVLFLWGSSDIDTGRVWLNKLSSLAPVTFNSVQETTPPAWLDEASRLAPKDSRGRVWTISMPQLTDEVLDVIATYIAKMSSNPRPNPDSVFTSREGHVMFEIIGATDTPEEMYAVQAWGQQFQMALARTDPRNILAAPYLSLSSSEELDMRKVYGEHYEFLSELKRTRDPRGVFDAAIPKF
ncbi:FAD-binding domain-containing protein [Aspergillus sclerotioniger CBS 115572]|uniref:FAD-binding domain-containing protein n=1 Tax=Aspergillus sclerotioniger CBS 115572 TaxID=1450535 RepID=A0A317V463_9EURO|nr:FAD-binding domain-containing protein [Aspergillus sclerotioniger CBS 115572]PWY67627.1 FAD-binding domain-containing protein [Aspergillus sclerotioniger CBS 115572]